MSSVDLGPRALKIDGVEVIGADRSLKIQVEGVEPAGAAAQAVSDHLSQVPHPSAGEKSAMAGTTGTPSNTNRFVTNSDSRLTNARAPTAHSHAIGDLPVASSGASSSTQLVRADDSRLSNARAPTAHSHAIGDLPVASSGASSATQLVRADDSRLSNARAPTAHNHPVTEIDATGTRDATTVLHGDGAWRPPSAAASTANAGAKRFVSANFTGPGTIPWAGNGWMSGNISYNTSTRVFTLAAAGKYRITIRLAGAGQFWDATHQKVRPYLNGTELIGWFENQYSFNNIQGRPEYVFAVGANATFRVDYDEGGTLRAGEHASWIHIEYLGT